MALEFFDTHCHVHEITADLTPVHDKWFADKAERSAESVLESARGAGVTRMLAIGTTLADSKLAVQFAGAHEGVWASIGIHPHEAKDHVQAEVQAEFAALITQPKVVAVGECGLDYFYGLSPKADQEAVLRFQIELALKHDAPLSFHVREAFDDFWPIFESYQGVRGVLHSFTDTQDNLERALGQYVLYHALLRRDQPARALFLAVPNRAFEGILSSLLGRLLDEEQHIRLIVFEPDMETIVQWIE